MTKQLKGFALLSCLMLVFGFSGIAFAHLNVTLYSSQVDGSGDKIPVTEANGLAYSAKATCGGCHTYSKIEQHSYHAQLGANQQVGFDAYNPTHSSNPYVKGPATKGKSWVQSPGHAGKW